MKYDLKNNLLNPSFHSEHGWYAETASRNSYLDKDGTLKSEYIYLNQNGNDIRIILPSGYFKEYKDILLAIETYENLTTSIIYGYCIDLPKESNGMWYLSIPGIKSLLCTDGFPRKTETALLDMNTNLYLFSTEEEAMLVRNKYRNDTMIYYKEMKPTTEPTTEPIVESIVETPMTENAKLFKKLWDERKLKKEL